MDNADKFGWFTLGQLSVGEVPSAVITLALYMMLVQFLLYNSGTLNRLPEERLFTRNWYSMESLCRQDGFEEKSPKATSYLLISCKRESPHVTLHIKMVCQTLSLSLKCFYSISLWETSQASWWYALIWALCLNAESVCVTQHHAYQLCKICHLVLSNLI